jgi:hypothetical protein
VRYVTLVQTSDGINHADEKAAQRHAEKRHSDAHAKLSHRITALDFKYSAVCEFVADPATAAAFAELAALAADCEPPAVNPCDSCDCGPQGCGR